jgi:hypothetical protein
LRFLSFQLSDCFCLFSFYIPLPYRRQICDRNRATYQLLRIFKGLTKYFLVAHYSKYNWEHKLSLAEFDVSSWMLCTFWILTRSVMTQKRPMPHWRVARWRHIITTTKRCLFNSTQFHKPYITSLYYNSIINLSPKMLRKVHRTKHNTS